MKITVENQKESVSVSVPEVKSKPGLYKPLGRYEDTGYVISTKYNVYWIDLASNNIEIFDEEAWDDSKFTPVEQVTLTFRS